VDLEVKSVLTYDDIIKNEAINEYIKAADASLLALGFTEHSKAHVAKCAQTSASILETLNFDARTVELAKIAAYLHDIGNLVNRIEHSQSGAVMAFRILDNLGMPASEIATVVTAIGNHDEGVGVPVSDVSAALILADKSDVRRSRVRNSDFASFDIHDRVNYSVESSRLYFSEDKKHIILELKIDTSISSIMNYFEIFLERMLLCRKAADKLGLGFDLIINGQKFM
jgi:metal-dependent HD superfamily phosphatase/phosphodiesterase